MPSPVVGGACLASSGARVRKLSWSSIGSRSRRTRSVSPRAGTNARSVGAAMARHAKAAASGSLELTPKTINTSRSAIRVMNDTCLADCRFGTIRLSRLTWEYIEALYAGMGLAGRGPDWIRRCGGVLTRSLELARKRGLTDSNPAKDAVRPKSTRKKPFAPLADDVRILQQRRDCSDDAREVRETSAPASGGPSESSSPSFGFDRFL
jgi:hypothetical protein